MNNYSDGKMNSLNLYLNTCRLALEDNQENRDSYIQLYNLLPLLRQSLSCTVCEKLLRDPYTSSETACQHHVCKICIGSTKRLKPSCSWCKDYDTYVENSQVKMVIQCYVKLCSFIKNTGLAKKISGIIINGDSCSLSDIINEAAPDKIIKCHNVAEVPTVQNNESGIRITTDSSVKEENAMNSVFTEEESPLINDESSMKPHPISLFPNEIIIPDIQTSGSVSIEPNADRSQSEVHQTINYNKVPINTFSSHFTEKIIPIASDQSNDLTLTTWKSSPGNSDSPDINSSSQIINSNISEQAIEYNQPPTHPVYRHTIEQNIGPSNVVLPTSPGELPKLFHQTAYPSQSHQAIVSSVEASSKNCIYNIRPSTIFSSSNNRESLSLNSPTISNPAMYSVMYNDNDSTKITLKRKPADIENISVDKDQFKCPSIDALSKRKPKPKPKRKGCRCGNATQTPGKLTCCGQRCPCYVAAKACIECQCRGCRNPHRPGGKKVRPHIPQLENIQIHQVQTIHSRTPTFTNINKSSMVPHTNISTPGTANMIGNNSLHPVYRTVHSTQSNTGLTQIHAVPSGLHQLINLGGNLLDPTFSSHVNLHQRQELSLKPVSIISSVPAHLMINDDKSSNSASDASDVDVDT